MKTDSFTYGIKSQGRKEMKKHLEGEIFTFKQAVLAKCYHCMCGYTDGKVSCEIPECPLFPIMQYRGVGWD
jgi:hypothetical protein|tara:strand:+ start:1835 stop:2047 length:213 start_codon:yes stop_codon:yes gene_type:complete